MGRLYAVRAGGPTFVAELRRAWERGDAVLPVDPRLPPADAEALERALGAGGPIDDGDAVVVATSGTTGAPKGVVLTHGALAAGAEATSARLGVAPSRDRWLACLPLAHVGGLSVVTRALLTGTPLVVHERFDAASVMAAAREGCTLVSLVATALARIDPAAFRAILLGGGPPPETLPGNVVVTYGLTETGGGVVYDGVPLDGVEVRIGEGGAIEVRGPMLLRAYRDGTDPKSRDGWLRTGDVGTLDGGGRLAVLGRSTDLIITGGENVWPAPVEAVLCRHPAIGAALVVGEPDPEWGERVVAHVEPAPGAEPVVLTELRAWAKARLAAYAVPRQVVWHAPGSLPRTALGKLRRARPSSRA